MSFQDLELGPPRRVLIKNKQDATQALVLGIFQINTAVSTYQRLICNIDTHKNKPELCQKLHRTRVRISQLVKDTSAKLKQASEENRLAGVSASKKVADARLAKDFETVLRKYQKAQRLAVDRDTAHVTHVDPYSNLADGVDAGLDKSQDKHAVPMDSRRQEVMLLDNEIAFTEAIIEEREQGIREIQQQIEEVNEIFKDLAVLVSEQGTMIDDVSIHIENSEAATAQGSSQLAKASKTQRSNTSLKALHLVIFVIVLLIVIVVLGNS